MIGPPRGRSGRSAGWAALCTLTAACGAGGGESDARVTDSAGVRIVASPGDDRPLPWPLTEIRRIGGADSGAASFSTANPSTVAVDDRGLVYVLDAEAKQVAVFDTSGAVIRVMGREGGGPGEMQFPIVLQADSRGTVEVVDIAKGALVRFGPEGEILPEVPMSQLGGIEGTPHRMGDSTLMLVAHHENQERVTRLQLATPTDTTVLAETRAKAQMVQFSCVGIQLPPPFTGRLLLAPWGRLAAVTVQSPYVVDLFRDGRLVSSLRRDVVPVPSDDAAIRRLYPEGFVVRFGGGGKCVVPVAEFREKVPVAPSVPLIRDLALAPDGTVWVQRYTFDDEPPRVDVFGPSGGYLGTLEGKPVPLGFAGDLVLFSVTDSTTGGQTIGVWRVRH